MNVPINLSHSTDLLKGCLVIKMEVTLLEFALSFVISFSDTIGARYLNCLSSCLQEYK